jgi:signal transduction histidine kinase
MSQILNSVKNLSLQARLCLYFLSILVFLCAILWISYRQTYEVDNFLRMEIATKARILDETNLRAMVRTQVMETGLALFVRKSPGRVAARALLQENVDQAFTQLTEAFKRTSSEEDDALVHTLQERYVELRKELQNSIEEYERGHLDLSKGLLLQARSFDFGEKFIGAMKTLLALENNRDQESSEKIRLQLVHLRENLIGLTIMAALWCLFLAAAVSRSVGIRLATYATGAARISEGVFEVKLEETGPKEFSLLAKAFNKMAISLSEARAQVAQKYKMALLGEMAAGIAHEINSPLATIKNLSEQMREVAAEPQLDHGLLKVQAVKVEETVLRISQIIHGLKVFSREGKRDAFQVVNVAELFNETLLLCSERLKHSEVKVSILTEARNLNISGRRTEISQVLLNLLSNSADAIKAIPEKWITISALEVGEHVEIRVTDSGAGIPEEVRAKIFQPFFTTKEEGQGTGIGLNVSRRIIESHGGELEVDITCTNTCFVARIPKAQSEEKHA